MRLICGILQLDGTLASSTVLESMSAAMTAPGLKPMLTQKVEGALGLAVLDFSGKQDGLIEQDNWLIASDAQLFHPKSAPADVMIDALQLHGADFPDEIYGDFALALWDRNQQELWLGRDFIGARPLAWTWQPGRFFAFASLPKGIYGAGLASDKINPIALASKVAYYFFKEDDSGFAEIAYLQAGHSLCVRLHDQIPPQPYRAFAPKVTDVGSWKGTAEQAAETLRQLVGEAVAARFPQQGAIGCHLTGGLDSSSITVLAAREAQRRGVDIVALSMITPTRSGPPELDEVPLIQAVLDQEKHITHVNIHDELPVPGMPEDTDWPGSIIGGGDEQMFAAAADFSAHLVLSGVGGDECTSYNGANLYLSLFRQGYLRHLARELVARAKADHISLFKTVKNRLLVPMYLASAVGKPRQQKGLFDKNHGITRFLNSAIVDKVLSRRMPMVLQSNSPEERICAIADHHIPSRCTYYAVMAARHGVSVSFPLLDRRVVEFILSLPVHMFLADGQSRQPFRRAMQGVLPEKVRLMKYKVGLYDDRFARYAVIKDELLAKSDLLRQMSSPLVAEVFNLDSIHQVVEHLPDPNALDQFIRTKPERVGGTNPPWLPLAAVQFLRAAWRLSDQTEKRTG